MQDDMWQDAWEADAQVDGQAKADAVKEMAAYEEFAAYEKMLGLAPSERTKPQLASGVLQPAKEMPEEDGSWTELGSLAELGAEGLMVDDDAAARDDDTAIAAAATGPFF